ncbi:MAG: cyclic nucleotide-binding domain-containing protein, partial [Candidatus Binatia bacterium]
AADADGGDLDAALGAALAGADVEARHVALDELRASLLDRRPGRQASPERWSAGLARLRERLDEPRDRARALEILADLAAGDRARLAAHADGLLAYAADPDPHVRAAVVRFAGHAHLAAEASWIVDRLDADHEAEVAAAGDALRALGPLALEALLVALHRGARATRDAVLPILRDLHLAPATVRGLIDREIGHMQRTVLLLHGLASGASELVLQRLRERLGEHLHSVLILLATQRDAERFVVLGRLLARTPQGRGRAVLLEALEALLPPDERGRIMPLLDDGTARAARVAAEALRRPLLSFEQAVREAMADADPLTVAFLAATQEAPRLADRRDLGDTAPHRDDAPESPMLSRVEIVLHLRGLHLFADLTTRQLSQMAALVHEESHPGGTTILREGEFGECMYLILSGDVSISRADQYTLSAGPGELFGEMSLFDGETRFATVTAAHRVRLLRLERRDLFELMDEQPGIAIGICQTLARHARDSIRRLEEKLAGKE